MNVLGRPILSFTFSILGKVGVVRPSLFVEMLQPVPGCVGVELLSNVRQCLSPLCVTDVYIN